ncbi:MAG TPA: aldo/keto reductase [Phycisphaerae bacterium]|nr:aldo/keto reductase [Phycisphaerae bacterium]
MKYRTLGRTKLSVGELGLGTEYLIGKPQETVHSVVHRAIDAGVNFIDLLYGVDHFLDQFGVTLRGCRERVYLAAHMGSGSKNGQIAYFNSPPDCERLFAETLQRLDTDHIDVLFAHMVDSDHEYDTWGAEMLELAGRYQQQGKVRHVGLSSHDMAVALRAVRSGDVDVLMFPLSAANDAMPDRQTLLSACLEHDVGLIAMKPFAGGRLFDEAASIKLTRAQSGEHGDFKNVQIDRPAAVSAVQCLSYVLSQIGVSTVIPGIADDLQLDEALDYLTSGDQQRDYGPMLASISQHRRGECVYCNHCLPCPVHLDIGATLRLGDRAELESDGAVQSEYDQLAAKASACTACGGCEKRCPFGVAVIEKMAKVADRLESVV